MADLSMVFDLLAKDRASSEVRKVGDSMDDAGRRADGFGGTIGKAMGIAAGAIAAIGIGSGLATFTADAAESAKISRLTEAAIKSTGGAAKISADQIGELATSLSNKTAIDDEAIQSASNLLLTFTNVKNEAGAGNDIFNQATAAALDMSTAMGTDANAAAMQLGKALNDPIKGVAALGKAGVQFTADQKEQIKTMVESGDVMGAQQMILGELSTQFGGAAAAAANPLDRLTTVAGNLGERIGGALLPHAEKFATWIADKGIPWVEDFIATLEQKLPPVIDVVTTAFTTVKDVVQNDVMPVLQGIGTWVTENQTTVTVLAGLIGTVLAAAFAVWGTRAIMAAAQNTIAWFTTAFASTAGAATAQKSALQVVAGWVLMGVQALLQGIKVAAVWTAQIVASAVTGAASFAVQVARVVGGWVLMGVQSLLQAARMAAAWFIALGPVGWIIAAVIGLVALIIANWETISTFTSELWTKIIDWIVNAWNTITTKISEAWESVKAAFVAGIDAVVSFVTELPGKIGNALSAFGSTIAGIASTAWQWFLDNVISKAGEAIAWVGGLPGRFVSALGSLASTLLTAGGDLLRGLWNGISGASQWLLNKIGDFFGNLLPGWVKDMLGIASPSKVFAEFGRYSMQGFAAGIDAEASTAIGAAERAASGIAGAMSPTGRLGYRPPAYDLAAAAGGAAGAGSTYVTTINAAPTIPTEDQLAGVYRRTALLSPRRA